MFKRLHAIFLNGNGHISSPTPLHPLVNTVSCLLSALPVVNSAAMILKVQTSCWDMNSFPLDAHQGEALLHHM